MALAIFPQNDLFFELFSEAASNMHRSAELMLELCNNPDRKAELVGAIREVEHKGDRITRKILKSLVKSFITPLEREDIHALASEMDNVVDSVDDAANFFVLVGIDAPIDELKKQAQLLTEATSALEEAIGLIKKPKDRTRCHALLPKVYDTESAGDAVHNKALARLFSEEKDSVAIMRWKILCDFMEDALDGCQRVANTVEMVILNTV